MCRAHVGCWLLGPWLPQQTANPHAPVLSKCPLHFDFPRVPYAAFFCWSPTYWSAADSAARAPHPLQHRSNGIFWGPYKQFKVQCRGWRAVAHAHVEKIAES